MSETIKKLSEDITIAAIQRTKGTETKRGYDTTGYGYQYCVDRFTDVCGDKWGFTWDVIDRADGQYKSGQPYIDITVRVGIWVTERTNIRECVGGHRSSTFADALKGAITNGFKKTAAFWGVGAAAYRGTLDDDNKPEPEHRSEAVAVPKKSELKPGKMSEFRDWFNRADTAEKLNGLTNWLGRYTWTDAEATDIDTLMNPPQFGDAPEEVKS